MAVQRIANFRVFNVIERPDGIVFCTDGNKALLVSTDDGQTWGAVPGSAGIVMRPEAMAMNALGEILTGSQVAAPSVYYSTPTSCTVASPSPLPGASGGVARFARGPGAVVYAINLASTVVHKSNDNGHTWTAIPGIDVGQAYACEYNQFGLMMGGEINKLYATANDGQSWTDWGLNHPSARQSTDWNGNLWTVATSPNTGTILAAIGGPDAQVPASRMQRHLSSDGVGVWRGVAGMQGSAGEEVSGWVWQADGTILAGGVIRSNGVGEIYKSNDDGASWLEVSSALVGPLAGLPRLYLGPSGRTYISDNNGLYRVQNRTASRHEARAFGGAIGML